MESGSMYIDYMTKWKSTTCGYQTTQRHVFFPSDSEGDDELPLNPDGRPKKDDVSEPVFSRRILFIYLKLCLPLVHKIAFANKLQLYH